MTASAKKETATVQMPIVLKLERRLGASFAFSLAEGALPSTWPIKR
jgi:hypothetical protein